MITIINKAVLHILDFDSGMTIFSEQELDAKSNSVLTYITKHVERTSNDPNSKSGTFNSDSEFKQQMAAYLNGQLDFISFSKYIAEVTYSAISQSDTLDPADLLVCDVTVDDCRFLVILKCNNKVGFTHQVINMDGIIKNEIINHFAILPSTSQKLDEYVCIEVETCSISYNDKKRSIDGKDTYIIPEKVLNCRSSLSQKTTIDLVKTITRKVSETHGQSSVAAVSKAKNYIVENAEVSEYLNPVELGREVFSSSALMQDEYIKEVKNAGIPEVVKVDREFAIKKGKNHKIKTDTGIELVFPADYFQNKEYMEFINNPDGTISIALKNIGKIINK